MEQISKTKIAVFICLIAILASLVLFLFAEAAVRVRETLSEKIVNDVGRSYTVDQRTGLRIPIPNSITGPIRINSLGFRSPEISVRKPPNTVRIAFIGASTTYGAELSSNEITWPHLVTATLNRKFKSISFEYINAGVPGYGVSASRKRLNAQVKDLSPDVIFIYHATNDFSSDVRDLAKAQGYPVAKPESNGWLARNSKFWYLLKKNVVVMIRQWRAGNDNIEKFTFEPRELSRPFENRLTDLIQNSQASAPFVAIATFAPRLRRNLSKAERTAAAVTAAYYMPHISISSMIEGYEEYNRVIRRVAKRTGAYLVEVENRIPADGIHYNDSVHFLDPGSKIMARTVADKLIASTQFRRLIQSYENSVR